jgi:hypothetical protein
MGVSTYLSQLAPNHLIYSTISYRNQDYVEIMWCMSCNDIIIDVSIKSLQSTNHLIENRRVDGKMSVSMFGMDQ